jgi:PAS domain S-box-containing protein
MRVLRDLGSDLARDSGIPALTTRVRLLSTVLLVCVGYYAGGILGLRFGLPPSGIAVIWPSTAILLAALLLAPTRLWWAYLLAVVPTHLHLVTNFQQPSVPLVVMLCQVASNAIHAVLGALAVRHVIGAPPRFDSLRNMTAFILLAAGGATVFACALAASVFLLTGWAADFWLAWRQRVLTNVFAIITIPPLTVLTVTGQVVSAPRSPRQRYGELGFLVLGLLAVGIAVFSSTVAGPATSTTLLFAPLPLLLWAAVRLGSGAVALSLLVAAGLSLAHASIGRGPFVGQSPAQNVLSLQVFLLAISVPLMLLAALVEERNRDEQALVQNEARYRAVVEDQTELICRFRPDGTYTFVNGAYCRYFQRSPEDLIGRTFWDFIPPEGHQNAREFLDSITPDHPVASREHEVLAPGGELRWQQWRDRGFFDDHGRVVEYQAVGRDITERKRAEEEAQQQREELAHALRVMTLGELTASFAHEINQPLTAIVTNAQAARRLLDEQVKPGITDALTDIAEDAKRASQIIRRLRTLFRKEHTEHTAVDINTLITDVVSLLRADLQRKTIGVSFALAKTVPLVLGDSVQLQQVMLNLVVNAGEAMAAADGSLREILIETSYAEPGRVTIAVRDSGLGVKETELERIFEHFVTTKPQGLGMGLAISRSIVQAHGGRIWAAANHDRGLTLHVELPAHGGGEERDARLA